MKTKVEDIRKELKMYLETIGYDCQDLSRRTEKHPIFDFIEIVVGMNKSLNQMMDECLKPQTQLHLLKHEQEECLDKISKHDRILESHENNFEKVVKDIEAANIKKVN